MKKLMFYAMSACIFLLIFPTQLNAENNTKQLAATGTSVDVKAVAEAQLGRLIEISEMDLSTLSRAEKNELLAEVRAIKTEMDEQSNNNTTAVTNYISGGGIYISVGGAILILILLILLL